MHVDFAFLADAAEAVDGKLYVMGGAIDTLWSTNLPLVYPRLALVMRLEFSPAELGSAHQVQIHLITEDGKHLATIGGNLELKRNPNLPKGWLQGMLTVLNFANIKFEQFGDYSFEIMVNNSSLKGVKLRIAQRVTLQS